MEKSKRISKKSDVYSFGVVLLELITGRKPICDGIDIVNWAKNPIKQALMGQYSGFVDSKLQSYNVEEIKLMICCAEHCVYKPSTDRPRIREIVRVLEGFIPPQDKDATDFLQHRVQKLSIIPETDDNDSVESEVYSTRMFPYQQLERATQGFSQFLGEGSLGLVYKGYLDGKEVAVRQLKDLPDEKQKENLEKDIKIIGSVNHPNLVRQIGYSIQGLNRFLALEFFPSISLKSLLHGKRTLEWSKRVKIAIDSARGLEYLHENCKIVHGDIMTNNILIDNNFQPKVTNFGLIKYYRSERTVVYADPEDRKRISENSDIYAFGVVLLELITGIESRKKGTNNIVNKAKTLMRQAMKREYTTILDPTLQGNYNKIEIDRMFCCAAACVYKPSAFRPQIKKIVGVLKGSIPRKDIWNESDNQFLSNTIVKESPPLLTKPEKMVEEGNVIACHTVKAWKKQYKRGKRLIVVDFSASWCGPSRFMSPILAGWAKLMPNVRFLTVDVDELSSVARNWAIEAMPTFLLLKRGQLLDKVVGANVPLLQLTIARHAGGAHRTLGPEVLNPAIFSQPTNVYVTLPTGYAQPQFISMTSVQNPQMFPPYPNYPY
ncbi:proline-rich receptor-like protein kinase PERK15 [Manihot esculenta]|uniref:Uncharacterized protein n=2 Tax=Manihot esculenta TaxID=3983 RepID=A0ACB7GT88_MANES|nr:proline-rich receptor-like protein kinase PERK15 [Manihot esculenta]XP_043817613.1 proline-rich receptor-like protein kinase PERK15 [Manihot esculenta]XP_043817614.1 proline-rich receptor-like protein kinase PERK15 [Manihot esculenta]XP_043817615.1 proline-rich receptor-like protein kinase PERK15 [Manihot esculenta]KAG8643435.1 hypothetical protein MANES_11G039376v8 [Manihot esculenta]